MTTRPSPAERLASLLRHARLFGTEGIYEVASGYPEEDRIRLRIELDAIEREQRGRRPRRRRGKAAATREAVRLLAADGLNPKAIANKLSVSDRTVRRYLRDGTRPGSQQPKTAPQTRTVERDSWPKVQNAGSGLPRMDETA